jgi:hypothetical protein
MSDDLTGEPKENEKEKTAKPEIPTNRKELRDAIFNQVTMIRPKTPDGTTQWFSPDAHVIAMVTSAVNSTAAAFDRNFWPGLVEVLSKAGGEGFDFEQEVFGAFKVIHDFFERSTTEECAKDMTFMDTLDAVGWNNMSEIGKVAYMSMFSQYFFARFWVACRQLYEMGTPSNVLASRIFSDAGELLRMLDNDVNPEKEANLRLRNAVEFAVRAGLSTRLIETITTSALSEASK